MIIVVNCYQEGNMKKICKNVLILFVFCLTFTFGGIIFDLPSKTFAEENQIEISNATDLKNYVDNYGSRNVNDSIKLTADINMSDVGILTKTIGSQLFPFAGNFDGRGFVVSNLGVDVSVDTTQDGVSKESNQYAGLFGVVKGATIKNVGLGGNFVLKTGGTINSFFGGLVAKVEESTISHVQSTAKITLDSEFDSNVSFGTLIGSATDTDISYVIARSNSVFGNWNFSRKDNKVLTFGGIAGKISNSQISFGVSNIKFDATFASSFVGNASIGGIVGNVSQGGSKIVNVACSNSFAISNNSLNVDAFVKVGEIAGTVSNPAPVSKNISYIHFKQNSGIERFGDIGNYKYTDQSNFDHITVSPYNLNALESDKTPAYFENQIWHPLFASWNFADTWYVGSQTVYLQSFFGNFGIRVSTSINTQVLTLNSTLDEGYRFGDRVEIEFAFNDIKDQENIVGNMKDFYTLSAVVLNGVEVAKIVSVNDNGVVNYRISGSNLFDITNNANGFALIIKSVNKSTSGTYNISISANNFKADIVSKLYKGTGNDQLVEGEIPGYVFYAEGANTSTEKLTLSKMTYGQTYRVETRVKSNTPNSFVGWYLVSQDGDIELSRNRILEFNFGSGRFVGNCEIYAKYRDNACVVTFKMDDGISKIDLYSGGITIEETGETVAVSKEESSLKLEIYVKKGHTFDVNQFIAELDTYKTEDPTKTFCTLRDSYDNGEFMYYHFSLDMTTLVGDFANAFSIKAQTTVERNTNNAWIWYVVGGVGGAVVLALVIFLIVFLVRRNKFGGGSGGGSFKKKSYKNMYY